MCVRAGIPRNGYARANFQTRTLGRVPRITRGHSSGSALRFEERPFGFLQVYISPHYGTFIDSFRLARVLV